MKKRFFVLLYFVACMRLSSLNTLGQPSVYSGVFDGNQGGLDSPTSWQAITNFVNNAKKDVSIINFFRSWTTGSSTNGDATFASSPMGKIRSHGSIPLYTWSPQNSSLGVTQSFNCASVIAGNYDAYINTWAMDAKNWGHPLFLRFAHEMNGNWYPWCAGVNGNTSAQYVQMWQHVHDIFTQVGATNVTWVWCVNTVYSGSTPIAGLYPGDNYVDWVALDNYNRLSNPWADFSDRGTNTIAQLISLAPGKPIMVAETGCNQNTNYNKSQWFLNALTNYLPAVQPRIKAWVYFNATNANDGNDWVITDPTNAVFGYQQGISLSYYDTNRYGSISSYPIQPLLNDAMPTDTMPPFVSIVSPATDQVTNGTVVKVLAAASDKSGVSNVVFSVNGVAQQTNKTAPYQFNWTVPVHGVMTYTLTATAYDLLGNNAVSTILVASQNFGTVTLTNSDATNTSSFNTAGKWDSGQPPTVGYSYLVGGTNILRTPTNNSPYVFAGDSLTVAGAFYFKETNVITVDDLELTNGLVANFNAGGNPNTGRLNGNINVITNATIDAGGNNGGITGMQILAPISGNGGLTFIRPNAVTLSGTNPYNGPVMVAGTTLILDGTAALTPSSLTLSNYVSGGTGYNSVTNLVLAGGSLNVGSDSTGVLRVGYRNTPGTNCIAVLDVSSQSNFNVNVGEFSVGNNLNSDSFTTVGSVYLATNNNVTATSVLIGYSGASGASASNFMTLGGGSNYFNTPIMTVGGQKVSGQLSLPTGGIFRFDNGGLPADLTLGGQNLSTASTCGGVADFSGGTFIASIGTLTLGQKSGGSSGGANGTLTMGNSSANNVNVNSVVIGSLAGATSGSPVAQGTLTFNGGNLLVNSNVTLASFSGSFGSASGTLNINGGTFSVAGSVTDGGGATALSVNGGLLDLKPAGDAGAGSITVDSLLLNGVITNALNVTVSKFSGNGTIASQTGVTTVSGSTTPGGSNSIGVLTAGALVLSGSTVMEVNRTNAPNADRLAASSITFGGTLTVTNLGSTLLAGDAFQLFSGAISGTFATTNLPALSSTNLHWDVSLLSSQGILKVAANTAATPTITAPAVSGTNFSLLVTASQAGFNYVLQGTTTLAPAAWKGLQTNAGTGGTLNFLFPITPGNPQQFFRISAQ